MPTYEVALQIFGTMTMRVEAASEEEARAIAERDAYVPSLCWHCNTSLDLSDEAGEILDVNIIDTEDERG